MLRNRDRILDQIEEIKEEEKDNTVQITSAFDRPLPSREAEPHSLVLQDDRQTEERV